MRTTVPKRNDDENTVILVRNQTSKRHCTKWKSFLDTSRYPESSPNTHISYYILLLSYFGYLRYLTITTETDMTPTDRPNGSFHALGFSATNAMTPYEIFSILTKYIMTPSINRMTPYEKIWKNKYLNDTSLFASSGRCVTCLFRSCMRNLDSKCGFFDSRREDVFNIMTLAQ